MKRMFGLLKKEVNGVPMDVGHAANTMFHAGVMAGMRWPESDPEMEDWYKNSFRKVTCGVTEKEFKKAKTYGLKYFVVTESAFGGAEVALIFKPVDEYPKFFQFLPLFDVKNIA